MFRLPAAIRLVPLAVCLVIVIATCAPTPPLTGPRVEPASSVAPAARQPKTLVIGLRGAINGFAHAYTGTVAGGAETFDEAHSQGLVTAGTTSSRPVPRLAAALPSLDDGTALLLPDG